MKVLPLKGPASLKVLKAFSTLVMGMMMLPGVQQINTVQDVTDFFASFNNKTDSEKENLLRYAASFMSPEDDELAAIVSFVADPNGVPYGTANIKNLGPEQLFEMIVAVCMEVGRIKIDLVTEDEKKNCLTSQST